VTDDELLEQLGAAFACDPLEGTPPSLHALNRALVARVQRLDSSPPRRSPRTNPSRRRWAIPALSAAAVLGGSGVALAASGTPLPEPVRRVAYASGLPVDSPDLAAARDARRELRRELSAGDRAAIVRAAAQLRARLHALNPDEHGGIENQTADLLRKADIATGVQQDQRRTANDARDQHGTANDASDQRETANDAQDQRGTANDAREPTPSTAEQQPPPASKSGNGDQPGGSQSGDSGSSTTDSSHTNENR
jgi:hypothetical protein